MKFSIFSRIASMNQCSKFHEDLHFKKYIVMGICASKNIKSLKKQFEADSKPNPDTQNESEAPPFKIKLQEIKINKHPLEISDSDKLRFSFFYKKNREVLQLLLTKEQMSDSLDFSVRLSQMYSIETEVTNVWIEQYIDYMILACWSIIENRTQAFCSPFAIQMVTRTHVLYHLNYEKCWKSLIGKEMIHYAPYKVIASKNYHHLAQMLEVYNTTKSLLFKMIHENGEILKTKKQRKQALTIWEPFELTILKNEFSFNFFKVEDKNKFIDFLLSNKDNLPMKQPNYDFLLEAGSNLRSKLGLDTLVQKYTIPNLILYFVQQPKENELLNTMKIDSISFPDELIKILCWENLLSLEDAMTWILEYKKFLFLLLQSGQDKTFLMPNKEVDRVWQLHIQFTEAYQLCIVNLGNIQEYTSKFKKNLNWKESYNSAKLRYISIFKQQNSNFWQEEDLKSVNFHGTFHVYFNRDILHDNPSTIKRFIRYKEKRNKLQYKNSKQYQIGVLENQDIFTLLQLDRDFFELNYEIECDISPISTSEIEINGLSRKDCSEAEYEDDDKPVPIKTISDLMNKYVDNDEPKMIPSLTKLKQNNN